MPMKLSALVGTFLNWMTRWTMGRVRARAAADTTKKTPSCAVPPAPQMAATVAATAPRQNQMLTSWTVASSTANSATAAKNHSSAAQFSAINSAILFPPLDHFPKKQIPSFSIISFCGGNCN